MNKQNKNEEEKLDAFVHAHIYVRLRMGPSYSLSIFMCHSTYMRVRSEVALRNEPNLNILDRFFLPLIMPLNPATIKSGVPMIRCRDE